MTSGKSEIQLSSQKMAAIRALFDDLPTSFAERHTALRRVREIFHEELATVLEKPLNEYINGLPQDTLEERKSTASLINESLRVVGLTIRCPKTGRSATLLADIQDAAHPEIARFRFEVRDETGKAIRTLSTRGAVPKLSLMQEHPRQDFWFRRSHGRDSRNP